MDSSWEDEISIGKWLIVKKMIKTIKEFLTSKFLRNDLIRNKEEIKLSIGKILVKFLKTKILTIFKIMNLKFSPSLEKMVLFNI